MSAQDILPELQNSLTYRFRRRILLVTLLILVFHYLAGRALEGPRTQSISRRSFPSGRRPKLPAASPPQHLVTFVDQRRSSYGFQDSLLGVTAVVAVLNREERSTEKVVFVVQFLVKYPFVKEVIIWNDDVLANGADMTTDEILSRLKTGKDKGDPLPALKLMNSPGGMGEMSSHMACSLAKFDTCYHIDENLSNLNLDTLYTKYVESNSRTEMSITNHVSCDEYLAELPYEIHEPIHHLDCGIISRLSRGSLTPKHLSVQYFQQLSTSMLPPAASSFRSDVTRSLSSDIQFSIWSNRRPRKLVTPAHSSILMNGDDIVAHLDPEFIQMTYQRLNETIRSSDLFLVPEMFPRPLPNFDRVSDAEIGVASAADDRSMLITNIAFSTHWPLAIDGDLSTCWTGTLGKPEESFVGLNFVRSVDLNQFGFVGTFEVGDWKLETYSTDNHHWVPWDLAPTINSEPIPSSTRYVYDLPRTEPSVKKLRLKQDRQPTKTQPINQITVCGWIINEDWII